MGRGQPEFAPMGEEWGRTGRVVNKADLNLPRHLRFVASSGKINFEKKNRKN